MFSAQPARGPRQIRGYDLSNERRHPMDDRTTDRIHSLNAILEDVRRTVLFCALDQKVSRNREEEIVRKLMLATEIARKLGGFGN
jgi:hypothetical protein